MDDERAQPTKSTSAERYATYRSATVGRIQSQGAFQRITVRNVDPTAEESALTGRLARVAGDLDRLATDGLRPAAMAVGILFSVFSVDNWLRYPPDVRKLLVVYDLGLVALGFT